ncbi:hypothetical protein GCM10010174_67630 [Kutzneria viridogrisea]|uniref:Transposase n=1 Tax=Kutzneria viridogrisea TaxID=47990 RepID=A0ABR6B9B6_9PSEU|nr:transposase [Kutzneria viridogrisea]
MGDELSQRLVPDELWALTSGCAWRDLPPSFGITGPTALRRFTNWTKAGYT